MIDNYIKKQLEIYVEFRKSVSRSREDIEGSIDNAVSILNTKIEKPEDFAEKYKAFSYVEEIIKEMCDNYLIDSHSQDISKDKINILWGKLKIERDSISK